MGLVGASVARLREKSTFAGAYEVPVLFCVEMEVDQQM